MARQVTLSHRRELLPLVAILLLAAALRVGWPGLTEFKFSEARLEALALELTRGGRLPLVGVPSSAGFDHSPLSVYLYVPAFLLTTNPIPATIYGGLVGLAAVALCWWLARRWPGGGRWAALFSILLFAVSPWAVAFSRKIWQVVFVPLLAIACVGLVISALVEEPAQARRQWGLAWALAVYAVLVQVHPSAVSLVPAWILWLLVFSRRVRTGPLVVGVGVGVLTAIPFLVHQVQNNWPALSALQTLPAAVWDLSAVRLAWEAITGRGIHSLAGDAYPLLQTVPQLGWTFNLVGWLTAGSVLWLAWQGVKGWQAADVRRGLAARVDLVLLSWLAVPLLFNLRHSLDLHLHFFALVMPAAYLIIGRAAEDIFRRVHQSAWVRTVGLAGLGTLAAVQVVALALMGRFVATHDTSGGFGIPLGHYLEVANQAVRTASQEDAAEVLVMGQGDSTVVHEVPAIFDVLLRDRVAYRFVDGRSAALFPPHRTLILQTPEAWEATAWYEPWPAQDLPHDYRLIALDGSWPTDDLNPVVGMRLFQSGVELQGYAWTDDAMLVRGIRLWLQWQVLWLSPDDTHFSVRLLDSKGRLQGQQDAVGYPTVYRQKGDRIISKFDITLSAEIPSEPSLVQVGLYAYPAVVDIPLIDGAGNPVGGVVTLDLQGRGP